MEIRVIIIYDIIYRSLFCTTLRVQPVTCLILLEHVLFGIVCDVVKCMWNTRARRKMDGAVWGSLSPLKGRMEGIAIIFSHDRNGGF